MVEGGVSDISLPADVVVTLIRTGTLYESDFNGTATYRLADGSVVPQASFKLHSIKAEDRVVHDVETSVSGVEGSLLFRPKISALVDQQLPRNLGIGIAWLSWKDQRSRSAES
jgi:hypothetical protein